MIQLRQSDRVMISTWAASASHFLSLPAIFLLPPFLPLCIFPFCLIFPHCCLDCGDVASVFLLLSNMDLVQQGCV